MRNIIGGILCALFVFTVQLSVATSAPTRSSPLDRLWGCWVVKKPLPTTGVNGLSQAQVDAIVGTHIVFGRACARSGHLVVASPKYSTKVVTARDFFAGGFVSLEQIGINDGQVIEVQLTNPLPLGVVFPGDDVFLRKRDIVFELENAYFLAERARPDDVGCACDKTMPK